jgi:hypothetical protein
MPPPSRVWLWPVPSGWTWGCFRSRSEPAFSGGCVATAGSVRMTDSRLRRSKFYSHLSIYLGNVRVLPRGGSVPQPRLDLGAMAHHGLGDRDPRAGQPDLPLASDLRMVLLLDRESGIGRGGALDPGRIGTPGHHGRRGSGGGAAQPGGRGTCRRGRSSRGTGSEPTRSRCGGRLRCILDSVDRSGGGTPIGLGRAGDGRGPEGPVEVWRSDRIDAMDDVLRRAIRRSRRLRFDGSVDPDPPGALSRAGTEDLPVGWSDPGRLPRLAQDASAIGGHAAGGLARPGGRL